MYPLNGILSDFFVKFLNKKQYQGAIKAVSFLNTWQNTHILQSSF